MVGLVSREGRSAREASRYTCSVQSGMHVVVLGVVGVDPWGSVPEVVPAGGRAAWHVQARVPGTVSMAHGYKEVVHSGLLGVSSIAVRELQQGLVRRASHKGRQTAVCDQVWVRGTVMVAAGCCQCFGETAGTRQGMFALR